MPSLLELQSAFAAALAGEYTNVTPWVQGACALDGAQALGIYRNNVLANYRNALASSYPVVRALIGESCFARVAQDHADTAISRSGDLNDFGGDFAATLAAHLATRELVYLPDLARLEWALDVAGRAADAAALDPASLADAAPDRIGELRFLPHPSLQLLASRWPALAIWRAHRDGEPASALRIEPGAYHCMVLRSPADQLCGVLRLGEAEYRFLRTLADGAPLAEAHAMACAADADFDTGLILQRHIPLGSFAAWRLDHEKGETAQ